MEQTADGNSREDDYPQELRAYFRTHNWRALWIALTSLLGAALGWAMVYFFLQWMGLLGLTVARGVDAPESISSRPVFAGVVGALLILGWIVRNWRTENHAFNGWIIFLSVIAMPARLTFSIFDNLRALVLTNRRELAACWRLLLYCQTNEKIPVHEISGLSISGKTPERLIYLLGITDLAETDTYGGILYLHPKNDGTRSLIRHWSRVLKDGED